MRVEVQSSRSRFGINLDPDFGNCAWTCKELCLRPVEGEEDEGGDDEDEGGGRGGRK